MSTLFGKQARGEQGKQVSAVIGAPSASTLLREELAASLPDTELKRLLVELREDRSSPNRHNMHNTYAKDNS